MAGRQSDDHIRAHPCPRCCLCSSEGQPLYRELKDRLFGAPGEWNFKKCPRPECGLVWLDPMPAAADLGKAYKNYYTHQDRSNIAGSWRRRVYRWAVDGYLARTYGYHSKTISAWQKILAQLFYFHPGRRENLNFSVMYLRAKPGGRLLDVGCGSGHKLKFLQDQGWRAEGVEIDPAAVESARAKGLSVRLGTFEASDYPDNYFDAVTMSHIIEHVYNPLAVLSECYRILKPGGRLVVVTPNNESWLHKVFKDSWLALDPPRHLNIFSLAAMRILTQKAGFEKIMIATTVREANGLFMASKLIRRTGNYVWGSPLPRTFRLWARVVQLAEWVLLKFRPDCGEEIALVGEK